MAAILDNMGFIPSGNARLDSLGIQPDPYVAPGFPTNVLAVAGDGTVTVSWVPPVDHGSMGIDHYAIYSSASGGFVTSTSNSVTLIAVNNVPLFATIYAVSFTAGSPEADDQTTYPWSVGGVSNTVIPYHIVPSVEVHVPQHQIMIADWRTQNWVELTTLSDRYLEINLNDPSKMTFIIPGDSPEALIISEGVSDIRWLRDGVPMFWGRLTDTTDTLVETSYNIQCTVKDYRALLDNREILLDAGKLYDGTQAVETVIWDLIDYTQSQLGGDLGIRKGIFPTTGVTLGFPGAAPDTVFPNQAKIWSSIRTVISTLPSVELDIDAASKALNIYYPQRGTNRGTKLDYGGLVSQVTRGIDIPGQYANYTRTWVSPLNTLNIDGYTQQSVDLASAPAGRWEQSFTAPADFRAPVTPAIVTKTGQYNFSMASEILPTMELLMAPGQYDAIGGPKALDIGDTIQVVIRRGRLDINDTTRVYALKFGLDQSNNESVSVTVGLPKLDPFKNLTDNIRRLNFQ